MVVMKTADYHTGIQGKKDTYAVSICLGYKNIPVNKEKNFI